MTATNADLSKRTTVANMKVTQVIGTLASAPCYGNVVTPAKSVPVGDGADDLEAAVDAATTPAVPLQPSGDDPLGLKAAFHTLFPSDPVVEGGATDSSSDDDQIELSEDGEGSGSGDDEKWGIRAADDASENLSDKDPNQSDPEEQHAIRQSRHYSRDGKKIYGRGVHIASITSWGQSISCHCRQHSMGKTPASTKYESDTILVDCALAAVDYDGSSILQKGQHIERAAALAAVARARR